MLTAGAVDFARGRGARRAHGRSHVTDEQRSHRAKDQARREHYAPVEALEAPLRLGQLLEGGPNTLAPLLAQRAEVGIARLEAAALSHLEGVPFVANQVDRHRDRQVAA